MLNTLYGGCFKKRSAPGTVQIENDGLMERHLYTGTPEAIISDEMFMAVQREEAKTEQYPEK